MINTPRRPRRRRAQPDTEQTPREAELLAQIGPLQDELGEIRAAREREEAQTYVGRYFRYRNSYGGSDDDDRWWMYSFVIGVGSYGRTVVVKQFEQRNDGAINIEHNDHAYGHSLGEEIPATEYNRAWAKLLAHVTGFYTTEAGAP